MPVCLLEVDIEPKYHKSLSRRTYFCPGVSPVCKKWRIFLFLPGPYKVPEPATESHSQRSSTCLFFPGGKKPSKVSRYCSIRAITAGSYLRKWNLFIPSCTSRPHHLFSTAGDNLSAYMSRWGDRTVLAAIWRGWKRGWKGNLGWPCWMGFWEGMRKLLFRIIWFPAAEAYLGSHIM